MKNMKRLLLELEVAWKALDSYAEHSPGCPMIWEAGGPCDCGLTGVRIRAREAALQLLTHYALHDAECPGAIGGKCDCGLDSARRRLTGLSRTHLPDMTGDCLAKTE